jgi:hypothetical protein
MLVSKPKFSPGDHVAFKVVNGDEIVAKLVSETPESYTISSPFTIVPSQRGIGLMQSLLSAEINTDMELSKSVVILAAPVIEDIKDHYIETTTGIKVTRNSKSIIT